MKVFPIGLQFGTDEELSIDLNQMPKSERMAFSFKQKINARMLEVVLWFVFFLISLLNRDIYAIL